MTTFKWNTKSHFIRAHVEREIRNDAGFLLENVQDSLGSGKFHFWSQN